MKNLFITFVAMFALFSFSENAFSEEVKVGSKIYCLERMVSQYKTTFNPSKKARVQNLKRARVAINGTVVKPMEVISFNEKVGPRTLEAGFVEAASFANGKQVTSIGGGICQVASTLSAAVIKRGLKVVERHRHSLPVSYISPEEEATVAWGTKDFKFQNTTDYIIWIKCFIIDNNLYVEFWKATVKNVKKV